MITGNNRRQIKRQQGCHPAAGMSKSIERRRKSKDIAKLRGFKGKCQAQDAARLLLSGAATSPSRDALQTLHLIIPLV